jgi:hypothetical protein
MNTATWILWGGGALLALLAALLAWRLARREARIEALADEDDRSRTIAPVDDGPIIVAEEPSSACPHPNCPRSARTDARRTAPTRSSPREQYRRHRDLRRRYIEERFPEIAKGRDRPERSQVGDQGSAPLLRGAARSSVPSSCCSTPIERNPAR